MQVLHRRDHDRPDPVELPPPELVALLFFLAAVALLLLRGG